MPLRKGRFDHLSREEAIDLLGELEGPLLELELSLDSYCANVSDLVFNEVFFVLHANPRVQLLFPTKEESDSWKRFKLERGDDVEAIGEFVYGPDENPWSPESSR